MFQQCVCVKAISFPRTAVCIFIFFAPQANPDAAKIHNTGREQVLLTQRIAGRLRAWFQGHALKWKFRKCQQNQKESVEKVVQIFADCIT